MGPRRLPRRALLAGAGGAGLAVAAGGCGLLGGGVDAAPGPDERAVQAARADEVTLLTSYAATLARHPDLEPALTGVVADHRVHLAALQPAGPSPTGSAGALPPTGSAGAIPAAPAPVPADRTAAVAALAAAEGAAAERRSVACVEVSRRLAPLLGSLAGSEAAHAALLAPLVAARATAAAR